MKDQKREHPRKKLAAIVNGGNLRYWLDTKMDAETLQLLIDVVSRYCEPRKPRRGSK